MLALVQPDFIYCSPLSLFRLASSFGFLCILKLMKGAKNYPKHFQGVKALARSDIDANCSLLEAYMTPEAQRPGLSTVPPAKDLPLIDLAGLTGEGRAATVQAIGRACQTWGVFWVKNHGISSVTLSRMNRVVGEFFSLPTEEKMKYFSTDVTTLNRYGTSFNLINDVVLNWRDFLRLECIPPEDMATWWPESPPSFREIAAEYVRQIEELHRNIRCAVVESLGLAEDYVERTYGRASMIMVCNCYPPWPNPELTLGLASHSDPGWISILLLDQVGGLQILHEGHWLDVEPRSDALLVQLADQMQILSNGRYRSVEHRVVVNNERERVSVVTGSAPAIEKMVTPAVDVGERALYRGRPYGEYLQSLYARPLDGKSGLRSLSTSNSDPDRHQMFKSS